MPYFIYTAIFIFTVYFITLILFYLLQEKLLFVPKHFSDLKPLRLASYYEEVSYETSNGGIIHGLLFKIEKPKGLIYYLHGNTGNIRRWGYSAEELMEYGYDVLVIDYRGFGHSKGKRTEVNMHQDVLEVFDQITNASTYHKHIVYGRSLGTGFAVRLGAARLLDYVILETPYYSMLDVAYTNFPFVPMHLLLKYKLYSNKHIPNIKSPIVIFHGTKDLVVRYKSGLKLFKLVEDNHKVSMITLVGGRHNNLNQYPLFREKLNEVLR